MRKRVITTICLCLHLIFAVCAQTSHSILNLECEHKQNPLGVENPTPRFSWQFNAFQRGFEQTAYHILVASSIEKLNADKGDMWDSGKIISSSSILSSYAGKTLLSGKKYFWKVKTWDKQEIESAWSLPSSFQMGLLSEKDWNGAQWIALEKDRKNESVTTGIHAPLVKKEIGDKQIGLYRLPQFRRMFKVNKEIKSATAHISGLGHFDFFLNNKKVGNNFLDPGWTKYDRQALYVTFDISPYLKSGENTLGVMLGNGFYNIPRDRYFKMLTSYGAPKMIMNIVIEYTDNTYEYIISDKKWKVTESPITYGSIYGGEDYDATKEQGNWMCSPFNDSSWNNATVSDFKTKLIQQTAAPLKIRDRLQTVRLLQTQKGNWIYDLGQNFSGIVELKVKGGAEKKIKLHPAELLNPDSTVNQSASGFPFYFSYTPKSESTEVWQPQFTYYGFRYVQIEGAIPAGMSNPENLPEIISITGLHTCNSAEEVGTFSCSNKMFNQIYDLIDWSIRSNMASVLTDCPHREKLGWLEVAHLMQYSIQYRYDVVSLYDKIMSDMCSTQASNGQIATTAPELVEFSGGFKDTPEWGSAFIISPWYIYQWYGDSYLLEKYYTSMQNYLNYLSSKASDCILSYGLGDWFDIGPGNPGEAQLTTNGVTATAIYYYNATIMQKVAELLGKKSDAEKYAALGTKIKQAFNDTFWDNVTKKYDRDSQSANAVALYMGLTNSENEKQALDNLISDIKERDNALTAGDVGYRYVLRALEMNNASDIIYDMNCKYDVPGYGWQLAHGATSLTESWQAYGFVSNNHCMLGHLMEWLFSGLGGIRQADSSIGFKHVEIKPEIVGDIREADVTHKSPYGQISSKWTDDVNEFLLRVEIPANSKATIYLPYTKGNIVTEGGSALEKSIGIINIAEKKGKKEIEIGSGIYYFKVEK